MLLLADGSETVVLPLNNSSSNSSTKLVGVNSNTNSSDLQEESPLYMVNIPCREKSYLSIILTVIPLWVVTTIFIILLLLYFHRSLRATKVYDNCTKRNANYLYHIEIRTGDTSTTYNKRRTTLSLDMFDDCQTTLARVAVPGYLIFGRKESPIPAIDDDRFFELRITRFWLYRASRFKRISTIRVTHNCSEPDARIMVYGVEIRSSEPSRYKIFFPVMNFISSYGSTMKPNACFDLEPNTSISALGGSQVESISLNPKLSWLDLTLIIHIAISITFCLSTVEFISDLDDDNLVALYEGLLSGFIAFATALTLGLALKYLIKKNYSLKIGTGSWAIIYYGFLLISLLVSIALWIYTAIHIHHYVCPLHYQSWLTTLGVAFSLEAVLGGIVFTIFCTVGLIYQKTYEPLIVQEESTSHLERSSRERIQSIQSKIIGPSAPNSKTQVTTNWPILPGASPPIQYVPMNPPPPYQAPIAPPIVPTQASYKILPTQYQTYNYPTPPTQPPNTTTYNQQTNIPSTKGTKKIGSTESTGSTYYHQLMKNKGGVKSISQYGELMKQKKISKAPKQAKGAK